MDKKKHCLIVAAGDFDLALFKIKYNPNVLLLVLDGAANHFLSLDVIPDYIMGDFDSIQAETVAYFTNKTQLLKNPNQNSTDLEKAILFAIEQKATHIDIISAMSGERTDHLLENLSVLKKYHAPDQYQITLYHKQEIITFLRDQNLNFSGSVGGQVGIFGFPLAVGNSKGLLWELENYTLEIGRQSSSSNKMKDTQVELNIKGEAILIRPV